MERLSVQQISIVKMAERGLTNKEIAVQLNVGPRAIETQFRRLKEKLSTANKTETIAVATKLISAKVDEEMAAIANAGRWMQAFMVGFDDQFRIVYQNPSFAAAFSLPSNDVRSGKELWKQIVPGMADKQRFKRLSEETSRDFAPHPVTMMDKDGHMHTVLWSSRAQSHPSEKWASWAVGWLVDSN